MLNYVHGGEIYDKKVLLDFSVNTNPLGLPEHVKDALINHIDQYSLYPDNKCKSLCFDIAAYENLEPVQIICGNGASDLIFRLSLSIKPKKSMVLAPTFSEYEKALVAVESEIVHFNLEEDNDFSITNKLSHQLNETFDILFLCNPNNPVGNLINQTVLKNIIDKCQKCNIFLVIDECFLDFVSNSAELSCAKYTKDNPNIFILKAFTKIYAMAGLRLGYGICSNLAVLHHMENMGPSWGVSIPAQIAGQEAIKQQEYRNKAKILIEEERIYLYNSLVNIGFKVYPPFANYIFFRSTHELYDTLLSKGILIRQCGNYQGLDKEYYRVAVKNHKDNLTLVEALKECIQ